MIFKDYWYVLAESCELSTNRVLARQILGERIACFRNINGAPTALRDRCLHRNAPLSAGHVSEGLLHCPYHGWIYDGHGHVVAIPSMGSATLGQLCSPPYPVIERDGYVYVRLSSEASPEIQPFMMPHYAKQGWKNLRLQNRFANNVANCIENFIDVPHTAFVHRSIFRTTCGERLMACVSRANGEVHVRYQNECANLGTFRWFLNPRNNEIRHIDSFYAPNISSVVYEIGKKIFIITSQATPVSADETLVYTDLTYNFGVFNSLSAPFVRWHGQRIIDQDIKILNLQMDVIRRDGRNFVDTPADIIHSYVDSIREAIARGEDPRQLPPISKDIEFFV